MKKRAKKPLGIVDFKNIRVLPSGYQVSIVRAQIEVSKHFAGHSEKSYRAAQRYRNKLLRELPDKRLNKIPRKLLDALKLAKPVVGVFRYSGRKFYQVSYRENGRQRSATFPWTNNAEVDAYRTAIEFRKLTLSRRGYKSGKRRHLFARLSWQQACDLGFRGNLEEWERLLGAALRRD